LGDSVHFTGGIFKTYFTKLENIQLLKQNILKFGLTRKILIFKRAEGLNY